MNETWKKIGTYAGVFLLGVLVGLGCLFFIGRYGGRENTEVQSQDVVSNDSGTEELSQSSEISEGQSEDGKPRAESGGDTEAEAEKEQIEDATVNNQTTYGEWSSESVYVGGDMVVYDNRIYKAKWWTQNETPGTCEVWEDTKETPASEREEQNISHDDTEVPIVNTDVIADEDFKVVVYYPSWKEGQTAKIKYDIVTHVNYAFAIPKSDGTLQELEAPETAERIIKEAHANGRKVLLAVGGWSYNDIPLESTFIAATETTEKVQTFGDAIVEMCQQYGFDGIDIDWEHPRVDGNSSKQYEALMLYLAEKLHEDDKLLTSAVISGVTPDGNVYYDAAAHTDAVLDAVDWVNIMAYDGGDGERHSSYEFAVNSGNYWLKTRGMDTSKVVLGMPFYGRPSWAGYEDILAADSEAYAKDVANVNGMEAHYNGIETIQAKTAYAVANFGGVMVWEITQDTKQEEYSLLEAMGKVIYE